MTDAVLNVMMEDLAVVRVSLAVVDGQVAGIMMNLNRVYGVPLPEVDELQETGVISLDDLISEGSA